MSVIREPGGGAVVTVEFRSADFDDRVTISPQRPLRVGTPDGTFEAPISGEPEVWVVHVTTISLARYRLAEAGVVALDAAGDRARVLVHDGTAYRTHIVRRTDVVE